ncbi:glycerol-3-phosphate acyltransferase [Candidatus Thorarchaeota archaeon]|nr:MAG: glycerol-3-phosphate acyltransferase [Candidatus Thorarchaeota archaeon]
MNDDLILLSLLIGYLAGSINFARIITGKCAPEANLDAITIEMEDGENETLAGFGAATASMVLGPRLGITIAIFDILKVIIPMLALKNIYPADPFYLIAGFGGLLGHNWPIYYRFRGGRGMSVMLGSFLVLDWIGTPVAIFVGFVLAFVILGVPMLAYMLWLWLMIPWAIWRLGTPEVIFTIVMNIGFLVGIIPELKTIIRLKRTKRYELYSEGLYKTSMRLRWMKEMTDRFWIFRHVIERRKKNK